MHAKCMHGRYNECMPTLQVRDVPEHIYEQLVARAKRERRSISQQAVVTLAEGLGAELDPREKRRRLFERAAKLNLSKRKVTPPEVLIREGRDR